MTGLAGATVLVTGASGVVGSEVARVLRGREDIHAVLCSTTGEGEVVGWAMGEADPPPALARRFDVVIHAAARTRWSQTPEEAERGNVETARALHHVVGPSTHLVFLSTAHAIGRFGTSESDRLDAYRNSYEWSKARAERLVVDAFPSVSLIRFPMVVGRRADGVVGRFSGFYKLLHAVCTGLLPAIVGAKEAPLDLVPVDDLAELIVSLSGPGACPGMATIAGGASAPRVEDVLDLVFATLDAWRSERQADPILRPPLLDPERWDRFYWPFVCDELTPLQSRAVDLFMEFRPYLCMPKPFAATHVVNDVLPALGASVRYWADRHERVALTTPTAWSA